MFAAGTDADAAVFDDVADAKTFAGGGPKAEMSKGRVAAVGRRENGRVEAFPAGVREECGHALGNCGGAREAGVEGKVLGVGLRVVRGDCVGAAARGGAVWR